MILAAPFMKALRSFVDTDGVVAQEIDAVTKNAFKTPSEGQLIIVENRMKVECMGSLGIEGNYKPIIVRQQNCSGFPKSVSEQEILNDLGISDLPSNEPKPLF